MVHWKPGFVMMSTVTTGDTNTVIMTTYSPASDNKVDTMTTLSFQHNGQMSK